MKKVIIALLLFSFLGLAASVSLTNLHYKTAKGGFDEKSFCNVSEFIDCDTAIASPYSTIGTIPTSEIGVLYYLLLIIGILFAWASPGQRRATFGFFSIASFFAILYSLFMAYISVYKLGVLCLLCLTTYVSNLAILLLLPRALEVRYRDLPGFIINYIKTRPRLLFHLGLTLIVFGVGLLFFWVINPEIHKAQAEVPRRDFLKYFYSIPKKEIKIHKGPTWGSDEGAKITIVEFSDFQCPFCRRAAFTLKPYLKEFRKDVRFVFMNYPLDSSCNPAIKHGMHSVACISAKAALCAYQEGKFWEYHDEIFENQKRLSRSTLLKIADQVGLNREKFDSCLASDEVTERLRQDVTLGNELDVHGTPAVFINGRPFRHWLYPDRLRMVLEDLIQVPVPVVP